MILVDTKVIIDISRGKPQIKDLLEKYREESIFISAFTIAELYDGLGYSKEKKNTTVYEEVKEKIEEVLSDFYTYPINKTILQEAGIIKGSLRAKGISLDMGDCIIGMTAKFMNADKIITRNPRHFEEFGILIEPYKIT